MASNKDEYFIKVTSDSSICPGTLLKRNSSFLGNLKSERNYEIIIPHAKEKCESNIIKLCDKEVSAITENAFNILLALSGNDERFEEFTHNYFRLQTAQQNIQGYKVMVELGDNMCLPGTVMYKGCYESRVGTQFGVRLEEPVGYSNGNPHFTCCWNHAVFVPINKIVSIKFVRNKYKDPYEPFDRRLEETQKKLDESSELVSKKQKVILSLKQEVEQLTTSLEQSNALILKLQSQLNETKDASKTEFGG